MTHDQLIERAPIEEVAAATIAAQSLLNAKVEEERVIAERHSDLHHEIKRARYSLSVLTQRLQDLRHVGEGKCAWVTHIGASRHSVPRQYCKRDADGKYGCCTTHEFFAERALKALKAVAS